MDFPMFMNMQTKPNMPPSGQYVIHKLSSVMTYGVISDKKMLGNIYNHTTHNLQAKQ